MDNFSGKGGTGSIFKSVIEEVNNKSLTYQQFVNKMKSVLLFDKSEEFKKELELINYQGEIIICDEPVTFIKRVTKCATAQERQDTFFKLCRDFARVDISKKPEDNLWFNSTKNGINLRPGAMNDRTSSVDAVTLGDTCVHGMIVGRTGSGKSVFLNNLIFNMITEYPPWELDLYLADFKKVELSRYMSREECVTPHICACAATSEIRYVVSLLQHLVDCMKARQNLFSALGILRLSELRDTYQVVLPRVLLLVDEFQQLFLEATPGEANHIQDILTSITKLGRATGFHLLFASQEMSGTLSSKDFANFKAKFALPCNAEISSTVLGNAEASKIEGKGKILVNTKSGNIEDNISYRVPFIDDKERDTGKLDSEGNPIKNSYFYEYLKMIKKQSQAYSYNKIQKFYQEDAQELMKRVAQLKEEGKVKTQIAHILESNTAVSDCLILGSAVVFRNRKTDYESVFIERGRKRNIGIICNRYDDCANVLKLLAENFKYSQHSYQHIVLQHNDIIKDLYDLQTDIKAKENKTLDTAQPLSSLQEIYKRDKRAFELVLANKNIQNFLLAIVEQYFRKMAKDVPLGEELLKEVVDIIKDKFNGISLEKIIPTLLQVTNDNNRVFFSGIQKFARYFVSYYLENKKITQILPRRIVWVVGIENIEYRAPEFAKTLCDCTEYNWLFILAGTSDENMTEYFRCCNYLFVNTPDSRVYDRYKMHFTKKDDSNLAIDFKICNMEVERAFKKFSFDCNELVVPEVNFD